MTDIFIIYNIIFFMKIMFQISNLVFKMLYLFNLLENDLTQDKKFNQNFFFTSRHLMTRHRQVCWK